MNETSTKPKGATSYKQTAFGVVSREKLLGLELEGTKKALEFIDQSVQHETLSPVFVLKIHDIAFGWIFPDWAGKYRSIRVEYSGKEAPHPYLIPELLSNLCADLAERQKRINQADIEQIIHLLAWFQHRFVVIHPFQDYNGRLARMLTSFILLKAGLPPIEIIADTASDRNTYLEAMYSADKGDMSKLENLIRTAIDESLTTVIDDQQISS